MTTTCDFHEATGETDLCTGWHSGGGDWPTACDAFVGFVEFGPSREAWSEIERLRAARHAENVAAICDTLADFLHDGTMPCGCQLAGTSVRCADHAAMVA